HVVASRKGGPLVPWAVPGTHVRHHGGCEPRPSQERRDRQACGARVSESVASGSIATPDADRAGGAPQQRTLAVSELRSLLGVSAQKPGRSATGSLPSRWSSTDR